MDCSSNGQNACTSRPQIQVSPSINTNAAASFACRQAGGQTMQRNNTMPNRLAESGNNPLAGLPIAMAYVPMQRWKQTYPLSQGFQRGTIFPELDLPFVMGRCRG